MKYIILFLLFPFLLFSQDTIRYRSGWFSDTPLTIINYQNKWCIDDLTDHSVVEDSTKPIHKIPAGWVILKPDEVGRFDKNGRVIWEKPDSVKSVLKEGWYIQNADRVGTYPKHEVLTFKPKPIITFQAGEGIELTHTDTSITISPAKPKDVVPRINLDSVLRVGPRINNVGITFTKSPDVIRYIDGVDITPVILAPSRVETGVLFSTPRDTIEDQETISFGGWCVQTEWLPYINNSVGCNHNWVDINKSMGDYFVKDFTLDQSKGNVGEDIRRCSKCKDVDYRLFFMGKGKKPFEHVKMFRQ